MRLSWTSRFRIRRCIAGGALLLCPGVDLAFTQASKPVVISSTDAAANCAEPAKTIADITIAATADRPAWASGVWAYPSGAAPTRCST